MVVLLNDVSFAVTLERCSLWIMHRQNLCEDDCVGYVNQLVVRPSKVEVPRVPVVDGASVQRPDGHFLAVLEWALGSKAQTGNDVGANVFAGETKGRTADPHRREHRTRVDAQSAEGDDPSDGVRRRGEDATH